jgi:hypothetical protein
MKRITFSWKFAGAVILALGWAMSLPMLIHAQTTLPNPAEADNSVYYETGTNALGGSVALVDATTYYTGDICAAISEIITGVYNENNSNGVVVDARGINAAPSQTLTCVKSPFYGVSQVPMGFSITVLLPASTIAIQQTWIMPISARLIGEGQGETIIQACNTNDNCTFMTGGGYGSRSDMIDMGEASQNFCPETNTNPVVYDCTAIGVEHLTLDANNQSLNGIVNPYSQELTYVNDVAIINVGSGGTGLWLANHDIGNSGPYSNIYYSGSGICAQIYSPTTGPSDQRPLPDTRGIHGLTCLGSSNSGAAIYIDGSYNSLEDIYISGFTDGILLGSRWSAQGNLIFNVSGASSVTHLIHISNVTSQYSNCPPGIQGGNANAPDVCDLTIAGVSTAGTYSIEDDLTGPKITDPAVGLYALGEESLIGSGTSQVSAFSRFTTSPSVPAWFVGSQYPSGSGCGTGSLYSVTVGSPPHTLYACVNGSWTYVPGT